jgi:hypothetical protein
MWTVRLKKRCQAREKNLAKIHNNFRFDRISAVNFNLGNSPTLFFHGLLVPKHESWCRRSFWCKV